MFTIIYKGYYIHGYCTDSKCRVQYPNGGRLGEFKSMHSAKMTITKDLRLLSC